MDSAEQLLVGYLLGALDDAEQAVVEARLQFDPQWRQELARVRGRLARLDGALPEVTVPPGLAERTCRAILDAEKPVAGPARRSLAPTTAAAGSGSRVSFFDMVAVVSIVAAAALVVFPAIQTSRFKSQVATCQDNLRDLGVALTRYSEQHQGYFPKVPTHGRLAAAGIYMPQLVQEHLLDESRRVLCPGSPLAAVGDFRVLDLDELNGVSSGELEQLLPKLGGSYGYSLGHVDDGVYRDTKNLRRPTFALMADVPNIDGTNRQSLNHGGRGENVLFEDGRVDFVTTSRPRGLDDIFSNDQNQIAAGLHADDAVIVSSATSPAVRLETQ